MKRNYYVVLGINPTASHSEIRTAYRQRALELHPDISGLDCDPFIELQEAYEVLADPARRRAYDRESRLNSAPRPRAKTRTRESRAEPFHEAGFDHDRFDETEDIANSFDEFSQALDAFIREMWGGGFNRVRPANNWVVEVPLSQTQAAAGGSVRIAVPGRARCPTCHGYPRTAFYECLDCDGTGVMAVEFGVVVNFPARMRRDREVQVPLDQCGLADTVLTVQFEVMDE